MKILIDTNGVIRYLAKPETEGMDFDGPSTTRRASNIEPCSRLLRLAFYAVRRIGSRRGEAWTRNWRCDWRVNLSLSGGPTFGRYRNRLDAIEAEEQWLLENNMGEQL